VVAALVSITQPEAPLQEPTLPEHSVPTEVPQATDTPPVQDIPDGLNVTTGVPTEPAQRIVRDAPPTPTYRDIRVGSITQSGSVDGVILVNGQTQPKPVRYNEEFTISWDTTAPDNCYGYGTAIPLSSGITWTEERNLPTSGSRTLIIPPGFFQGASELFIGFGCANDQGIQSTWEIYLPVTPE
jgi:hypothetical protein